MTKGRMMLLTALVAFFLRTPASVGQNNSNDDLFSITFANATDGWACGRWGTLLHTADGGRTWGRQITGVTTTLMSITFVDARRGWVVGDAGTILHTLDGGTTWQRQKSPVNTYLMAVYFANPKKGWIVSERTTILHTEDGGKTWAVQFQGEDYILKSVSFCNDRDGWAVGEYGYIYHTVDGGASWQKQAGEFRYSEETGDVIGGNYLFRVLALSPAEAWSVGIDGTVLHTSNGGMTWQQRMQGVPKTHLFAVALTESGTLLLGGDAVLLASADGGANWRPLLAEPPITYGWLYSFARRGGSGFAAVGKGGWIYVTGNDLGSWKRAPPVAVERISGRKR